MKTLIVDDAEADRVVVQTILLKYSECDFAGNGKEAIDAFQCAWTAGDPYDLVCLDIQMPILDGFEALKLLREMEGAMNVSDDERCRIFMITGHTTVTGRDRARTLGCDAYFLKPIRPGLFMNRVQTFGLLE